jgi:hypothetical protein
MQKTLGWIMLFAGMFMLLVGFMFPNLATVIYEAAPTITPSFPAGTQSEPTPLKANSYYNLEAYATPGSGYTMTDPFKVHQVVVTDNAGFSQTVSLTWAYFTPDISKLFIQNWVAPNLPDGTLLTFSWHTETKSGLVGDAKSYGKIMVPTGKFYINGLEANIDSVFRVQSATLQLGFTATQLSEEIGKVYIHITCTTPALDKTVDLTTEDHVQWTGSYTLPGYGTYTLEGYIVATGKTYRLMSLTSNYGEVPTLPQLNMLQIFGLASTAIGILLIFTGKKIEVT